MKDLPSQHQFCQLAEALAANDFDITIKKFISAIETIHSSPNIVESVWHPLGYVFLRYILSQTQLLRFHIWLPTVRTIQLPGWRIHNHNWHMLSQVFLGKITNEVYSVTSSTDNATNRLYEVIYDGPHNYICATSETVRLLREEVQEMAAGSSYSLEAGRFHSIIAPYNNISATVVLSTLLSEEAPRVAGDLNGALQYTNYRQSCDEASVIKIMSQILAEIRV